MATSIKIDDELKGRVQHLAGLRQRSPHWIMREAIAQYIEREEARESFKQEALASWTAYQEVFNPNPIITLRHEKHPEGWISVQL